MLDVMGKVNAIKTFIVPQINDLTGMIPIYNCYKDITI